MAPQNPLVFAFYVTGHGFGHATRAVEVARNLIQAGHDVHVVTAAPEYVFTSSIQSPQLYFRKVVLDCGSVQADALTIDRVASLDKYNETAVLPRDSILATEVEWLLSNKVDLVVSDVVPVACRAAADAGIRSICIANFSWDFIYAEYVMAAGYSNRAIIWQIAEDYSHCEFLIRLPGFCPMPAFRDVIDVPLVVRRLQKSRSEVRKELGVGDDVKVLIYNFGGLLSGWKLKEEFLPAGWICWVCGSFEVQELPPNFLKLPKDVYAPDLIAASDCMLGKIGYGTVSEALAYNTPFVFVRRDYFTEEPFLRNMLEHYQCGLEMARQDLLAGGWAPYIEHACTMKPCYEKGINGGEVAAQILQDTAYVFGRDDQILVIKYVWVSFGAELGSRGPTFDMDLSDFMEDGKPIFYEKARNYFAQNPSSKWAAYVAGAIIVLMTELGVRFEDGISMLVSSDVPEGKGVSSSAAVEVASMAAIAAAHGISVSPRDLALLCQMVENHIVGAPCGVMDQMASACGEANKFLAMLCQPAEVLGLIEIPPNVRFWGIDSGIRHSVGGADYGSVRIGAFMGRKMVKSIASTRLCGSYALEEGRQSLLESEVSLEYLCNLTPHRYEASYGNELPEFLSGQDFIEKYNDHDDTVTTIDKNRTYPVRAATRHPVYDNFRVQAFKALLSSSPSVDQLAALGELMYQCHYSYGACGLGSDGTDQLVDLVQEMQHRRYSESERGTLYGAKITGGGSGGTVCVMGEKCIRSSEQILEIQRRYEAATGVLPYIFEGSSPGAAKFGHLKVRLQSSSHGSSETKPHSK